MQTFFRVKYYRVFPDFNMSKSIKFFLAKLDFKRNNFAVSFYHLFIFSLFHPKIIY